MQFDGSLDYLRSICAYIYGHIEDFSYIDVSVSGRRKSIAVETQWRETEDEKAVDYDRVRGKFRMFMSALDDDTIIKASFTRTYCSAEAYALDVTGEAEHKIYEFSDPEPVDVAPESITELA